MRIKHKYTGISCTSKSCRNPSCWTCVVRFRMLIIEHYNRIPNASPPMCLEGRSSRNKRGWKYDYQNHKIDELSGEINKGQMIFIWYQIINLIYPPHSQQPYEVVVFYSINIEVFENQQNFRHRKRCDEVNEKRSTLDVILSHHISFDDFFIVLIRIGRAKIDDHINNEDYHRDNLDNIKSIEVPTLKSSTYYSQLIRIENCLIDSQQCNENCPFSFKLRRVWENEGRIFNGGSLQPDKRKTKLRYLDARQILHKEFIYFITATKIFFRNSGNRSKASLFWNKGFEGLGFWIRRWWRFPEFY